MTLYSFRARGLRFDFSKFGKEKNYSLFVQKNGMVHYVARISPKNFLKLKRMTPTKAGETIARSVLKRHRK